MIQLHAYILAGGQSRRFGSDKARAHFDGRPLIRRIADRIKPHVHSVTVVADVRNKYADLGLTTIADHQPGLGPIGGLATAIDHLVAHSGGGWLLLCSCDLIDPEPTLIHRLSEAIAPGRKAIAFKAHRWEPMFALYCRSIRPDIHRAIADDRLAMQQLLDRASATPVTLPEGSSALAQANTPAELRLAHERRSFTQ